MRHTGGSEEVVQTLEDDDKACDSWERFAAAALRALRIPRIMSEIRHFLLLVCFIPVTSIIVSPYMITCRVEFEWT